MGLDRMNAITSKMRWIRAAWLALDIALVGPFVCLFDRNTLGNDSGLVLSDLFFLPWIAAWLFFVFWRRFGDVFAKAMALTIGGIWGYECHEGIWRFVEGGAWDQVTGFMTHEVVNGLGFNLAWSIISWLLGGAVLWIVLRIKQVKKEKGTPPFM